MLSLIFFFHDPFDTFVPSGNCLNCIWVGAGQQQTGGLGRVNE